MKLLVDYAKLTAQRSRITVYLRIFSRIGWEVILETELRSLASRGRSGLPLAVVLCGTYLAIFNANYAGHVLVVIPLHGVVVSVKKVFKAVVFINSIRLPVQDVKGRFKLPICDEASPISPTIGFREITLRTKS